MRRGAALFLPWFAAAFFVGQVAAQTPDAKDPAQKEPLVYTGTPLVVPIDCTEDDIQWAGLTCVEEACPVYLELSHADGQGQNIILTGNFHTARVTLYSLMLRSSDGGRTWTEPTERVRGATLDRVQMLDAQNAVATGQLMQPIALDPFFLVSSDAGATWTRIPIFEEGTPGTILRYEFDSKDHGTAVVDRGGGDSRFEVYETMSGGRAWSIRRRTSEAPKVATNAPQGAWRIRPEAKGLRLEKFVDGRWSPFAAFAVQAGACKEKSAELPLEPVTEETPPSADEKLSGVIELTNDPDHPPAPSESGKGRKKAKKKP